jgi:Transglycosylase associated protein
MKLMTSAFNTLKSDPTMGRAEAFRHAMLAMIDEADKSKETANQAHPLYWLGIAGAFVATFIGQTIGWYRLDQGAGLIGATVGPLLVLFIWNRLVAGRVVSDPGNPPRP